MSDTPRTDIGYSHHVRFDAYLGSCGYLQFENWSRFIRSLCDDLDKLERENAELLQMNKWLCEDWADDELLIESSARTVLGDEYVDGDSWYVPGPSDIVDKLIEMIADMRMQLDQMDDERLSWKHEAEKRGEALAELRRDSERLDDALGLELITDFSREGMPSVLSREGLDYAIRMAKAEIKRVMLQESEQIDAAMNNKETKDDETSNQI